MFAASPLLRWPLLSDLDGARQRATEPPGIAAGPTDSVKPRPANAELLGVGKVSFESAAAPARPSASAGASSSCSAKRAFPSSSEPEAAEDEAPEKKSSGDLVMQRPLPGLVVEHLEAAEQAGKTAG